MRSLALILSLLLSTAAFACDGSQDSATTADSFATSNDPTAPSDGREPPSVLGATVSEGAPDRSTDGATVARPAGSAPGGDAGATPPPPPADDPGPPPSSACSVTKDKDGFFVRNSGASSYVAYVPASYDGSPMPVVVGLHGCGDNAYNFATWGVNPYATRATQSWIGISVDGASANNGCWSMGGDDDKVLAAVDDLATCFYVHRKKVTIAGFSSGGQLAYRVGLEHAERFDGILIECSGLYAAGTNEDTLLANAAYKLPIAHRAHTGDTVFPLASVHADWAKTTAAGFPLSTSEVPGGHDGVGDDWAGWLLPHIAGWKAP